jgi:hypothetical protein
LVLRRPPAVHCKGFLTGCAIIIRKIRFISACPAGRAGRQTALAATWAAGWRTAAVVIGHHTSTGRTNVGDAMILGRGRGWEDRSQSNRDAKRNFRPARHFLKLPAALAGLWGRLAAVTRMTAAATQEETAIRSGLFRAIDVRCCILNKRFHDHEGLGHAKAPAQCPGLPRRLARCPRGGRCI